MVNHWKLENLFILLSVLFHLLELLFMLITVVVKIYLGFGQIQLLYNKPTFITEKNKMIKCLYNELQNSFTLPQYVLKIFYFLNEALIFKTQILQHIFAQNLLPAIPSVVVTCD